VPRYVAFLRAINVGGRVVKMERLRVIFSALGFADVETFIASGNVIFSSRSAAPARLERQIEQQLAQELGYEVKTFVRSTSDLARIAATLRQPANGTLFIGFLQQEPVNASTARLLAAGSAVDEFSIVGRELYWRRNGSSTDSEFSGMKIEKLLGLATTLRNANTIQRLAAKYPP
jgi:uncharacterized protein (DUF1697 family)